MWLAVPLLSGCAEDEDDGAEGPPPPSADQGPPLDAAGADIDQPSPADARPVDASPVDGDPAGDPATPTPRVCCATRPGTALSDFAIGRDLYRLTGALRDEDRCTGGCVDGVSSGSDAVVSFTAPVTGRWRFDTLGSDVDTVLYVRRDCADVGSELACNDDAGGLAGRASALFVELSAGETVDLIVDAYDGLGSAVYTLTAALPVPSGAQPYLGRAAYVLDRAVGGLGVRAWGADVDGDVTSARVSVFDREDPVTRLMLFEAIVHFDDLRHETVAVPGSDQVTEAFTGAGAVLLDVEATPAAVWGGIVEVRARDVNGLESAPIRATALERPAPEPGGACDRWGVLRPCPWDQVCRATGHQGAGACVDRHPAECPAVDVVAERWGAVVAGDNREAPTAAPGRCAAAAVATEIFRFVPLDAGTYRVSTVSDDPWADTVVSVRSACGADGAPIAELGCDDDSGPGLGSALDVVLDAGRAVFIHVDSYPDPNEGRRWRGAYTLRIQRQDTPRLDAVTGAFDPERRRIGLHVSGSGFAPRRARLRIDYPSGVSLGPYAVPIESSRLDGQGFAGTLSHPVLPDVSSEGHGLFAIDLRDDTDLAGEARLVAFITLDAPRAVAAGTLCEPGLEICDDADERCTVGLDRSTRCQPTHPPELTGAHVVLAADRRHIMLSAQGEDVDADVERAVIELLGAGGHVIDARVVPLEVESLVDGPGAGLWSATGRSAAPPVVLQRARRARVRVFDRADHSSQTTQVALGEAATLSAGEPCHPSGVPGGCGQDADCLPAVTSAKGRPSDHACVERACPPGWATETLRGVGGVWENLDGVPAAAPDGDGGTCGGGGVSRHVYRFAPQQAGRYACRVGPPAGVSPVDVPAVDTVLFARRSCARPDDDLELACNDDFSGASLWSRIEFDLSDDEAVYLFVDGFGRAAVGAHRILCERV